MLDDSARDDSAPENPARDDRPRDAGPRLLSMRAAAGVLAEDGLGWQAARAVLLSGLAGPGEPAGGALLYDAARVQTLLSRPWVPPVGIERAFVARLAAGRLQLPTHDQQAR